MKLFKHTKLNLIYTATTRDLVSLITWTRIKVLRVTEYSTEHMSNIDG